ncbi:hypothetical protein L7F22_007003 [Adiantum nelumboides]|nr:hypothetical protein [Adiantum nelumboides]
MHGKGVSQDDFGGYRFQLAYMVYGLALTHRHRLPAAPGLFAPTIRRLVEKLLQPEVWLYWRDVSRGGSVFNAHLSDGYTEQWDPVVRDNIMYSAYVQSCATLHDQLFGSDHFAAPGALTFRHWSFFWGGEEKRFAYDRDSLTEHLYWLMVESGYLGVACEPNCVFQICNQPAILGFRLHDQITGGSRADEVVAGYERAWADFGRLDEGGHYAMMISEDTREVRPNDLPSPWADAWCGALMNTWNGDFVRRHYRRQVADFLEPGPDGTFSVPSAPARRVMGHPIVSDTCDFGWVAAWASEMGDRETLDGLLAHADRFMASDRARRRPVLPAQRHTPRRRRAAHRDRADDRQRPARLRTAERRGRPAGPLPRPLAGRPPRRAPARRGGPRRRGQPGRGRRRRAARPPAPRPERPRRGHRDPRRPRTRDPAAPGRRRGHPAHPGGAGGAGRRGGRPGGRAVTAPPIRATYSLVDHHGVGVTEATYRGRWQLVRFGFTACRVVCPRALDLLDDVLDRLGAAAAAVVPLYVTVDPGRDTPDRMRSHLAATHPGSPDSPGPRSRPATRRRPSVSSPAAATPRTATTCSTPR